MTENTSASVSAEDMLIEQALTQMNKPKRVKSGALLVALVEFANSGDKTRHHFEQKYPTVNANRLNTLIKSSAALTGKVWSINSDEFGVSLINVTPAPATPAPKQ